MLQQSLVVAAERSGRAVDGFGGADAHRSAWQIAHLEGFGLDVGGAADGKRCGVKLRLHGRFGAVESVADFCAVGGRAYFYVDSAGK